MRPRAAVESSIVALLGWTRALKHAAHFDLPAPQRATSPVELTQHQPGGASNRCISRHHHGQRALDPVTGTLFTASACGWRRLLATNLTPTLKRCTRSQTRSTPSRRRQTTHNPHAFPSYRAQLPQWPRSHQALLAFLDPRRLVGMVSPHPLRLWLSVQGFTPRPRPSTHAFSILHRPPYIWAHRIPGHDACSTRRRAQSG
jgi:hypothetical protein